MLKDTGGAVIGQGVVPLGLLFEPVDLPQVTEKHLAGKLRAGIQSVEIDVLSFAVLTVVCP